MYLHISVPTSLSPLCRVMLTVKSIFKLSSFNMVTRQPVDEVPVAKVQVTVMLPLSSMTAETDWRPVVTADHSNYALGPI